MKQASKNGRELFTDSSQGLPYHNVHIPRKVEVSPSDKVRPFAEIDKLLAWHYHPKHAFR